MGSKLNSLANAIWVNTSGDNNLRRVGTCINTSIALTENELYCKPLGKSLLRFNAVKVD